MDFCWEKAQSVWVSAGGSAGVVFVRSSDGNTIVVKGSSKVCEELFASKLSEEFGIRTAKMKMIRFTDPEWSIIKVNLFKCV